ncbi:hypothetical protein P4N68_05495 [Corynebacterium felinum]|uniref:Uncharacterized protein n=1 Tax=Corynebacterium felinum TaxID=131318 RepID=A0ABU2B669_9CORY|nr:MULTISPECIES: hypothetical protein [Corynebacterium]MDF5820535.1 hypothetical protein [Corynebacterium felinum]MDO4761937.1 hypothetical protein [Corynebacterium sp.]MDR7354114.1 hypothetical protein [Corynebacterium felinum]WJY96286.1 hypothetical protein CFELI_13535 [Corynebacterium felinum]
MTILLVLVVPVVFALFPMWMDKLENAVLTPREALESAHSGAVETTTSSPDHVGNDEN